ncbi:cell envelope integrity protein TolA [Serratia microhaemolytica]|uniref:cell envelope integrity protein TolA n=1 Tax=Serratia microhaemolytica TaxID=2675110 RepID=UPI000FDE41DF|nr:cell envelope integrity protein TolA [Serratia microhaemolytica]
MVKTTGQNHKLKRAVVVSVILHVLVLALIIWGSLYQRAEVSAGGDGVAIDAIMVDPAALAEQYHRQQQQASDLQRAEQLREKRAQQQAEELQQKQAAEQQRLKQLERERLLAQEKAEQEARARAEQQRIAAEQQKATEEAIAKAKQQQQAAEAAAAKAKAEAEKLAAAQALARKKAEEEAKKQAEAKKRAEEAQRAAVEAEKKAAEAAKQRAAAEAERKAAEQAKQRAAAEQAKKAAEAEAAKQSAAVENLFGDLADDSRAPQISSTNTPGSDKPAGQGSAKTVGASGVDVSGYASQIQAAIREKFFDPTLFVGKTCSLHIALDPEGNFKQITAVGGDAVLCQLAISSAKLANIPKPPNQAVYQYFKDAVLEFKP